MEETVKWKKPSNGDKRRMEIGEETVKWREGSARTVRDNERQCEVNDSAMCSRWRTILLRSQLNAKISLSFKRDFENDHSKLRILVDSRLENQRIWRFVLTSTIPLIGLKFAHVREANRVARKTEKQKNRKTENRKK